MTNDKAVQQFNKFISSKAPMLIKPTPKGFECAQPFVVVAKDQPAFVMGDFSSIEQAQSFCKRNYLPVAAS